MLARLAGMSADLAGMSETFPDMSANLSGTPGCSIFVQNCGAVQYNRAGMTYQTGKHCTNTTNQ
jgi:hypothetical protein